MERTQDKYKLIKPHDNEQVRQAPTATITMAAQLSIEEVTKLLMTATLANKTIPKFDRKGIKNWLFQFEKATAGEDDDGRIRRLAAALSGDDVEWFQAIEQSTAPPATFDEWKIKFQEKFTEPIPVLIGRLRDRKQLENEDPETYAREVIRLSKQINPAVTNAEVIHNLTSGVLEKYRRDLIVMKPQTPDEFIGNLKTLSYTQKTSQTVAALDARLNKLVDVFLAYIETKKPQNQEPVLIAESSWPQECQLCNESGHQALECPKMPAHQPQQVNNLNRCRICRRGNHTTAECFYRSS